ncbi:hypothetical protein B0J11DRAFT_529404, partial [Dendryphion nanum]
PFSFLLSIYSLIVLLLSSPLLSFCSTLPSISTQNKPAALELNPKFSRSNKPQDSKKKPKQQYPPSAPSPSSLRLPPKPQTQNLGLKSSMNP